MRTTIGENGLGKSWQKKFPKTTKCMACGGISRIGFVAHEGMDNDKGPYVCDLHKNKGKGNLWLHDCCSVAVYFCRDCLLPTALYNQG
jgi:hypothetical protein